ncbi:phage major capsid protein [Actinomadura opuntiae]|uniref:phage major capsid protein n=1 Tax=Actinomadura sp. OS1-43 TaxID=604315 RepID=UPI00255AF92E|nr:hypothetical protein [Actinomadura sp. OS1-43]MDL4812810.1 hypothetical protein [Actinomadura sp. OS1-43]
MPTFPPAAPTLSGDLLTIHRLLQSPTLLQRRLRTITDLRFVSDQILTQRFRSSGGSVLYEVSEPITSDRPVESVAPGGEYPMAATPEGAAALAAVLNWGQATLITDAEIKRTVPMGNAVDRKLRKLINSVISRIDSITMSAVGSAVTNTLAAGAAWDADAATIMRDLERGKAEIIDLNQGYAPDTVLMSSTKYAELASDEKIAALRRREATDNPVYTGTIDVIDDLKVVTTSSSNLPSDDVWILDSVQLGGMADETDVDPGYTVSDLAVQVQTQRVPKRDSFEMWARRITVPVIQEPAAALKITGT